MIALSTNQMRYSRARLNYAAPFVMKPRIIAIAGTSSNSGKTTLLCDLLRELSKNEAWEAIKLTRGHYRSCGKDPHACCVSHLLSDQPIVRSGRAETYAFGKDTGRYWDAGASNVHWVIATDSQVEAGVQQALARVKTPNVLIEGTGLLRLIPVDFAVLVIGHVASKAKPSARQALIGKQVHALYYSNQNLAPIDRDTILSILSNSSSAIDTGWLSQLPFIVFPQIPALLNLIRLCSLDEKPGLTEIS